MQCIVMVKLKVTLVNTAVLREHPVSVYIHLFDLVVIMDRPYSEAMSKAIAWPSSASSSSSSSSSRSRSRSGQRRFWLKSAGPATHSSQTAAHSSQTASNNEHVFFNDYGDSLLNLAQSDQCDFDSQDTQLERLGSAPSSSNERLIELQEHAEEWHAREQLEARQRWADFEVMREMRESLEKAIRECSGHPITFHHTSLSFADDDTVVASLSNIVGDSTHDFYIGGTMDVASRWLGADRRGMPLTQVRPPRAM
jgi:hypothetical protein